MSGWKEIELERIVNFYNGKKRPYIKGNIPVFGGNGILDYCNSFNSQGESIIIGRVGEYCGNVNYYSGFCWVSDNAILVKPKEGVIAKYIYYCLSILNLRDFQVGSSQPLITQEILKNIPIPLPPLPEQKAIAEVLSSLDDKIELLHRQNKTLEEMAMTIFRKWFIEDAKEDWGDGVFGDIVQPKKGKNITKKEVIEGPYPVVAGGIEPSCYHNLANTSEPVVTISASGANAGYVRLYHTKVWASDSSYIDYSVTPYVYFSYIFLKTNQRAVFDKQVGSVQPHVYPMQIMELNCMHYPEKLISKFEKWCTPMFTKIKSNQLQISILEQIRDILLPKLMSGEVRVKV